MAGPSNYTQTFTHMHSIIRSMAATEACADRIKLLVNRGIIMVTDYSGAGGVEMAAGFGGTPCALVALTFLMTSPTPASPCGGLPT